MSFSGPPQYLITDRRTEYLDSEMENCCSLFSFRHSPRTSHGPSTNGLAEVQNKIIGTRLRMFVQDTPKSWSIQVYFFERMPMLLY